MLGNFGSQTKAQPVANLALLPPPPVLSTEDPERFKQVFEGVVECIKPSDMLELILVRHYVDAVWTIDRLTRHSSVAIDRWYRQQLDYLVQRQKVQNARKEAQARHNNQNSQTPPDIAHLTALENKVFESVTDIDDILKRKATEIEHNRALEKGILFQEQLDRLVESATKRRNDALRQLELYRAGLGQFVREATDQIIDAECKEVEVPPQLTEAPSLVSSNQEDLNDVDPQNSGESAQ